MQLPSKRLIRSAKSRASIYGRHGRRHARLSEEGIDEADDGLLVFLPHVLEGLEAVEQADVGELRLFCAGAGDEVIGGRSERVGERGRLDCQSGLRPC